MKHVNERKVPGRVALLGFFAGLLLLAGCASSSGKYREAPNYNYNNNTGYPAVGLHPWVL